MNLETAMNNAFFANIFNGFDASELVERSDQDCDAMLLCALDFDVEAYGWDVPSTEEEYEMDCDDGDDGQALASAGWGTDEDYNGWEE
jgi:hypothetical protein